MKIGFIGYFNQKEVAKNEEMNMKPEIDMKDLIARKNN